MAALSTTNTIHSTNTSLSNQSRHEASNGFEVSVESSTPLVKCVRRREDESDSKSSLGKKSVLHGACDVLRKLTRSGSSRASNLNDDGPKRRENNAINVHKKTERATGNIHYRKTTCADHQNKVQSGQKFNKTKKNEQGKDHKITGSLKMAEEEKEKGVISTLNRRYRSSSTKEKPIFSDDMAPRLLRRKVSSDKEGNEKDAPKPSKNDTNKEDAEKMVEKRYKPPQNPTDKDVESTTHALRLLGFIVEGKLGEGTYAKVRAAYSQKYKKRVALKIISRHRLNTRFQRKFLPRELALLKIIKHKNIVELFEIIDKNDTIIVVMELARHGDLLEYIQRKKVLLNSEAKTIFVQVLDAVEYLHLNGIFHRDLKCENVLLDWAPTGIIAKLTDFGFARLWSEPHRLCRTYCGSAAYASPEILQGTPYDPHGNDVWSLGVILFIMITGRMPYDDSNIADSLSNMFNDKLTWPTRRLVCQEIKDLIESILKHDLKERATLACIRRSDWVTGKSTRAVTMAQTTDAQTTHRANSDDVTTDRATGKLITN